MCRAAGLMSRQIGNCLRPPKKKIGLKFRLLIYVQWIVNLTFFVLTLYCFIYYIAILQVTFNLSHIGHISLLTLVAVNLLWVTYHSSIFRRSLKLIYTSFHYIGDILSFGINVPRSFCKELWKNNCLHNLHEYQILIINIKGFDPMFVVFVHRTCNTTIIQSHFVQTYRSI